MAKTSQRRSVRYEKDQAGCMWAFISIFDRHGRNTRPLLSDKKRPSRQVGGTGCSTPKRHVLKNSDGGSEEIHGGEERNTLPADDAKTSVKELINDQIFCEQDQKTLTISSDVEAKQEPKSLAKKNPKRRSRTSKSCSDIHFESDAARNLGACFKNLDAEALIKELYQQIHLKRASCMKHERISDIDIDERFIEAVKTFVNRRFAEGKRLPEDWETNHSKEFLDGLETLDCDKELILKLLKDRSSLFEESRNSTSPARSNKLDGKLNSSKSCEPVGGKQHKFFRRRSRSQERIPPSKEDENCKTSNTIVILKPGSAREAKTKHSSTLPPDYSSDSKVKSKKVASQFSFTEIKRKLKNAMGKERRRFPSDDDITQKYCSGNSENTFSGGKGGWNSPNRNHFLSERFTKPTNGIKNKDKSCKPKDVDTSMGGKTVESPNQKVSNIYIEAKKHLLEMLSKGEETEDLSGPQLPETLARVLSFPDYNFSPMHEFVTAKERLSMCNYSDPIKQETDDLILENHEDTVQSSDSITNVLDECNNSDPIKKETGDLIQENHEDTVQSYDSITNVLDDCNGSCTTEDNLSSVRHEKISEDEMEIVERTGEIVKKESEMDTLAEQCCSSVIQDDQNQDLTEVHDRDGSAQCLKLDSFEQDQLQSSPLASPSNSSSTKHDRDVDNANEKTDRYSPVSVLEPLFIEEDVSPASIKFVYAAPPVKPQHFDFEDHLCSSPSPEMCIRSGMEDMETPYEYVETVLLASDLNWEDFISRWLSSHDILDASLFDEVVLFSNRPQHDQKLFFDCANGILKEVCDEYFGFISDSPRASCVRHNVEKVPRGKELIDEVWRRLELHLQPPAYTLDEIVNNDMDKTGSWMDLRFDSEEMSIGVGDTIFNELLEDAISSFADEAHQKSGTSHPDEDTIVFSDSEFGNLECGLP